MRRLALVLAGALLLSGPALAEEGDVCAVSEDLVPAGPVLPHVVEAIANKRLDIAVVGTASSTLRGPNGPQHAYPAQLEQELTRRLPGVAVKVVPHIEQGTTATIAAGFTKLLAAAKPNLIIWQTGTSDVMLGTDPDTFHEDLDKGLQFVKSQGVDIILMNLQYSPRTDPMMHVTSYAEAMRMVAEDRQVPLFDRMGIMKYWTDEGAFDFYSMRNDGTVERVHHCLGRLLADMIASAKSAADTSGQ
jgi:GDSL-like Lipase/Acylhydrolase family